MRDISTMTERAFRPFQLLLLPVPLHGVAFNGEDMPID